MKRCRFDFSFDLCALKLPGQTPSLTTQELDEESGSLADVSSTYTAKSNEAASVKFDASSVNPNPRHHTTPDQGSNPSASPRRQDPLLTLPRQRLVPKDQTPSLRSLPNMQQPNKSSSTSSQVLTNDSSSASKPWEAISIPANPSSTSTNSGTDQIPTSSPTHLERHSTSDRQKLPAPLGTTTLKPPETLKSGVGRAPDVVIPSTSISPSHSVLPLTQKSSFQALVHDNLSPPSNASKQTDYSIPVESDSAYPSATNIRTHGQELVSEMHDVLERKGT